VADPGRCHSFQSSILVRDAHTLALHHPKTAISSPSIQVAHNLDGRQFGTLLSDGDGKFPQRNRNDPDGAL